MAYEVLWKKGVTEKTLVTVLETFNMIKPYYVYESTKIIGILVRARKITENFFL